MNDKEHDKEMKEWETASLTDDWNYEDLLKEQMTDKEVYTVTREGTYRHEIVGIYNDLEDAKERAIEAVKDARKYDSYVDRETALSDGYHKYWVMKCPMNRAIEDGKIIVMVSIDAKKGDVYIECI